MSKYANPGELRTPVEIKAIKRDKTANGYPIEKYVNVFGEGALVNCKWVNVHGTEVFESLNLKLREPATLTLRYSDKITHDCIVVKKGAEEPYEIISVDDVEERGVWLELKVQKKEGAI